MKRIIISITYLILLFPFIGVNAQNNRPTIFPQNIKNTLLNTIWISDFIVGLDVNQEMYKLRDTAVRQRKWAGNIIYFNDSLNFTSGYEAWCGNDNFTTVKGTYQFVDTNKIALIVTSVSYSGDWIKPTEYREGTRLIFLISKTADKLILTKVI